MSKNVFKMTILASLLILAMAFVCNAEDYVLITKPSPADAGVVSQSLSDSGLVNISASAKNGYQFVYWLGDVADPTAQTTTVATDSPKLVIAVYERTDYDFEVQLGGAGGIMDTAGNGQNGTPGPGPSVVTGIAPSAPGAKRYNRPSYNYDFPDIPDIPEEDMNPDFPVPDEQVPEPSTLALFALAGLKLMTKKRTNTKV